MYLSKRPQMFVKYISITLTRLFINADVLFKTQTTSNRQNMITNQYIKINFELLISINFEIHTFFLLAINYNYIQLKIVLQ